MMSVKQPECSSSSSSLLCRADPDSLPEQSPGPGADRYDIASESLACWSQWPALAAQLRLGFTLKSRKFTCDLSQASAGRPAKGSFRWARVAALRFQVTLGRVGDSNLQIANLAANLANLLSHVRHASHSPWTPIPAPFRTRMGCPEGLAQTASPRAYLWKVTYPFARHKTKLYTCITHLILLVLICLAFRGQEAEGD